MAVDVTDWTLAAQITGNVTILGTATVSISGTPAVTVTSGSISIGNVPSVIVQSGSISIGNVPAVTISGTPSVSISSGSVSISSGNVTVIGSSQPWMALGDLQGGTGLPPLTIISLALAAGATGVIVGGVVNKSIQYFQLYVEVEGGGGVTTAAQLQDSGIPTPFVEISTAITGGRLIPMFGVIGGNGHSCLWQNLDTTSHNFRGALVFRQ